MTAPFLASGESQGGRVPSWVWPLVPIAISGFFVSALTWFQLRDAKLSSGDADISAVVVALYRCFGFEATFMVSVLVLSWSSIWFFSGSIVRPWARLLRIGALGLSLSILLSLKPDGSLTELGGYVGGFFAAKLSVVFGSTLTILMMVLVSLGALALATDFFFYRQFESLALRPSSKSKPQPRPEEVDEPGSGAIAGVERDAVFELESLKLADPLPRPVEASFAETASVDEDLARAVDEVVAEIERRDAEADGPGLLEPEAPLDEVAAEQAEALAEVGDDGVREIDLEDEPEIEDWAAIAGVVEAQTEEEAAVELETEDEEVYAEDETEVELEADDEAEGEDEEVYADDEAAVELAAEVDEEAEGEDEEVYADDEAAVELEAEVDEEAEGEDEEVYADDDAEVELEVEDEAEGEDQEVYTDEEAESEDEEVYADDDAEVELEVDDEAEGEDQEVYADDDAEVELEAEDDEEAEGEDQEVYADEGDEAELEVELDPEMVVIDEEQADEAEPVEATVEIPMADPDEVQAEIEAASVDEDRSWVVPRPGAQQSLFASAAADEELVAEAEALVVEYRRASVNFLKRRLRVGHDEAFQLLQELARRKIVDCEPGASSGRVIVESV